MPPYIAAPTNHRKTAARARWHRRFGCPSRIGLDESVARARTLAGFAALYLDLDDLNALNDAIGHAAVDARINAFWRLMQVRRRDLAGQWEGGDEFCVAVPDADALGVAARVRAALSAAGLSGSIAIVLIADGLAGPALEAAMDTGEHAVKAARGGARGCGRRGVLVDTRKANQDA